METSMETNSLFETKQPNHMTADDLPTIQDDPTVKRLTASLEQLAQDERDVTDSLETARAALADAEAHAEDMEVEQYADPDVSEADVEAAQDKRGAARFEVDRLEKKADRIGQAIERVDERLGREIEEDAAARLYEAYAPVVRSTTTRAIEVLSEAIDAVEKMNEAHAKAEQQGVKAAPDATQTAFGVPVERLMRLKKPRAVTALREVKKRAADCLDRIDRTAPED